MGFSEKESVADAVKFALEATNTDIWRIDIESGSADSVYGPPESLYKVDISLCDDIQEFFTRAVHPDDLPKIQDFYLEVKRGEKDVFKTEYRTHPDNGEIRWLETHGQIQSGQDGRKLTGITTDITERKNHEQELAETNERLDDFASIISHDFRNPLHVAEGHLELAQEELEADENEHLESVARAHERMDMLVENVLESARDGKPLTHGGASNEALDEIDLVEFAQSCWRNVDTEDATLMIETSLEIHADRQELTRLFENLIRNAIDHGGSDVTVSIGSLEDKLGFYVSDDGPGIPNSIREDIFEKGFSTTEDGVGLGLHIVMQVAKDHEWDVTVTESQSGGARFEFREVRPVT